MMKKKFNPFITHPCPDCPFRKDCPKGWLGRARAKEIADSLLKLGQGFTCHKTNDYDNETGEAVVTIDSRGCAGAALVLLAEDRPNQAMQAAERLDVWQEPTGEELVFESMEEFIKHHT